MLERTIFTTLPILLCGLACAPARADDAAIRPLQAEAASLTAEYAGRLKTALAGAMEAAGPLSALSVCHDAAPEIAADISRRSGWSVARTSLKPRNASSAPDDYERKVMDTFSVRIANGENAADLISAGVVEQKGRRVFRFVKAISTAANCLACHGGDIKPELKRKISELYPDDRATGFKIGDMRGVFTLQKDLGVDRK